MDGDQFDYTNNMDPAPGQSGIPDSYPNPGCQPDSQEDEPAPGFFMQLPYSFNPQKYAALVKVKTGAMIGFIVLLLFVLTALSYIRFALTNNMNTVIQDMLDAVPDFSLENSVFWIEEPYEYDEAENGIYILATDEADEFSLNDAQSLCSDYGYRQIFLVSKHNMVVLNNGEYSLLSFADLKGVVFDKEWILTKFTAALPVFIFIGYIFYFIGRSFWYFVCAAVYMLIAMVCAAIFHKKFSAGILFKASVYAKVLMTAVAFVVSLIPVSFAIPAYIRTMITLAMIIFAFQVLPRKSDV